MMTTTALRLPEDADPTCAELLASRPALAMHAMDGLLLEDVPLNAVADAAGTPTWVLSAGTIRSRLAALCRALDAAGQNGELTTAAAASRAPARAPSLRQGSLRERDASRINALRLLCIRIHSGYSYTLRTHQRSAVHLFEVTCISATHL